MAKKRYEVAGMMEWHPIFMVGRTKVQVSFTGGHLCGGACTPASYETSDPVVQAVIESSAAFSSGRIRKTRVWGEEKSAPVLSKPAATLRVMEFENIDKASDFLQHTKGVPLERIITADQCMAEARKLGLEFKIKG